MERIKKWWLGFEGKHPSLSKWVREGGLFMVVSTFITVIRGLLVTALTPALSSLGGEAIGFPGIALNLFGVEFSWYIIGASEEQGGVAYFVALMISMWTCELINFLMQRKFVFRSNGNILRQGALYFLAFLIVTLVVNALSNIWIGVASHYLPQVVCDLGTTFLTGGVAMVVFFLLNRVIFNEPKNK